MTRNYDLFEQCKRGSPTAQRMLYDIFKAKLMGLCRRYTRNREEAQDVLQEAFIKIFSSLGQLEAPEKLEAWMKSTVVNTAISHFHRTKKKEIIFTSVNHVDFTEPTGPYSDLQEFSDQFLISLIHELPDGCRVVFNLFAIEGYSHGEIAALLKITEGTSRSQFHHAKYLLKTKLNCQDLTRYYEKFA